MTGLTAWKNRIVGHGDEAPDQLLANPKNWRVHPSQQQQALEGVLDDVGWVQQVIVNRRTNTLIDGHLRVSLALRRNEPRVPVVYVDLSEDEEALILATLDPLSAMAATDAAQLDALLREVSSDNAAVMQMLAELAEQAGVVTEGRGLDAPETFNSYGDDIETEYCCPKCGYEWSGKPK
ncbi:MAG TPA: hypothetical protein VFT66_15715 [Roseiflexaceae bacterium]|nr:hypothetical protein [Roseiflexaceae bacterium]